MPRPKNFMEDIVFSVLSRNIQKFDVCQCETCYNDIAAIVLNRLPPKYVATPKGELFAKVNAWEQQFEIDVLTAVAQAVEIVHNHSRHGVNVGSPLVRGQS